MFMLALTGLAIAEDGRVAHSTVARRRGTPVSLRLRLPVILKLCVCADLLPLLAAATASAERNGDFPSAARSKLPTILPLPLALPLPVTGTGCAIAATASLLLLSVVDAYKVEKLLQLLSLCIDYWYLGSRVGSSSQVRYISPRAVFSVFFIGTLS